MILQGLTFFQKCSITHGLKLSRRFQLILGLDVVKCKTSQFFCRHRYARSWGKIYCVKCLKEEQK